MSPYKAHELATTDIGTTEDGRTVVAVDTKKARFFDLPWEHLGGYGKRKFENLIVIDRPKERLTIIYH